MTPNDKLERINAEYTAQIRGAISPGLHPDQLAGHGTVLVDDLGGPAMEGYIAGRQAMKALYMSISDIDAAHTANLIDVPTIGKISAKGSQQTFEKVINPAKANELSSSMASHYQRTDKTVTRCLGKIDEAISGLEGRIKSATTHPNGDRAATVQVHAEIRAHVRAMDGPARTSWVQKRIEAKDADVMHAICSASPYASGISPESHNILKSMARETFAPRETNQVNALLGVKTKIAAATNGYARAYQERLPNVRMSEADRAMAKLKGAA